MKVEIVANGTMSFVFIPENDFERAAYKMLLKQRNEFVEVTKQTQIINKASFTEGFIIQQEQRSQAREAGIQPELTGSNETPVSDHSSESNGGTRMELRGNGRSTDRRHTN